MIIGCRRERERMAADRQRIFVSYSHSDVQWLRRLTLVLDPLVRGHQIDLWDDSRIQPGAQWRSEIEEALDAADVGVLLSGIPIVLFVTRWQPGAGPGRGGGQHLIG